MAKHNRISFDGGATFVPLRAHHAGEVPAGFVVVSFVHDGRAVVIELAPESAQVLGERISRAAFNVASQGGGE